MNLHLNGRIARTAQRDEGPNAGDLDRLIRVWRVGQELARQGPLDPVLVTPRATGLSTRRGLPVDSPAVRKVSRAAVTQLWHRGTNSVVILDVLAGRECRIEVPPREVAGLGLDVRLSDVDIDLLVLLHELKGAPRRRSTTPPVPVGDETLPRTVLLGPTRR
ncbi:hypothetical protein [Mariniluteicoccus flavus]